MASKVFISADYSQAEARVVAWAGPIPRMREWFQTGEDIHLNVARMIGKIVNEHKLDMPFVRDKKGNLARLWSKSYESLARDDPERQISKNTVHGNNYDMGPAKFAFVTGLLPKYAKLVQDIYHALFPEIRNGYHEWIKTNLKSTRTIENPYGWKRTFYDIYGPELERAAYAWYPQSTIGMMTIRTLRKACEIFQREVDLYSPTNIRSFGYNVQLQVHDSIIACCDNDTDLIRDTCKQIKELGEESLLIKGEALTVPMDFKVGPSWGELVDYVI